MSKQDIIETVEKSIKSAMSRDAKFQAKHRSTGKEFKPNYKPIHRSAQPVYAADIKPINKVAAHIIRSTFGYTFTLHRLAFMFNMAQSEIAKLILENNIEIMAKHGSYAIYREFGGQWHFVLVREGRIIPQLKAPNIDRLYHNGIEIF